MSWTATLREKKLEQGKWDICIRYTNGVTTVDMGYILTAASDEAVKALARQECAAREAADAGTITITNGSTIDLTPPAGPPPPTQAEIDEAAWFAGFANLRRLRSLANNGMISQSDTAIPAQVATLKATWLPSYLSKVPT